MIFVYGTEAMSRTPIVSVPRHVEILREVARRNSIMEPPKRLEKDKAAWEIIDRRQLVIETRAYAPTGDAPCEEFMAWKVTNEGHRLIDSYLPVRKR